MKQEFALFIFGVAVGVTVTLITFRAGGIALWF